MPLVDYYFAPQSPFTYLGHPRFMQIAKRHKAEVRVLPIDLMRVFAASGGLPLPQRAPQRQAYRMAELERFGKSLDMPINLEPRFFPVAGDTAARLLIAVDGAHGPLLALQLQEALGRACWVYEEDIADQTTLSRLLTDLDLDANTLLRTAQQPWTLARYQAATDEALKRGVFGAPTFVVGAELFWGQDRLDFVERALAANSAPA